MGCICYWKLVGMVKVTDVWQARSRTWTCNIDDPRCDGYPGTYSYVETDVTKFGERVEEVPSIGPPRRTTTTHGIVTFFNRCDCPPPPD
jgi:hypothetical protein